MKKKNIKGEQHPQSVYFNIDGQKISGIPTTREQFIEFFNELETLLYSDDKKYWVLYEEINPETPWCREIFWCIPQSEIEFIYNENGWNLVGRVTLDEDNEEEYNKKVEQFDLFEARFAHYVLFDPRADETIFKVWQSFQKWLTTPTDEDTIKDNKYCFLTWAEENWKAWFDCIMDVTSTQYKYMNLTQTVWESWKEEEE